MRLSELVIATGNRGKLAELHALLADSGIEVRSQEDFAVPGIAEIALVRPPTGRAGSTEVS